MSFSIKILLEEIKAVISEKIKLGNRDKSKLLASLEVLVDLELDTWMKTDGLLTQSSSTTVKFSNQDLTEEIQPVAEEIEEFECRDVTILTVRFGNFRLSGL